MRVMMAVPMYPHPIVGGLERQARELSAALARRGHIVRVISSLFDDRQAAREMLDEVEVLRLPRSTFRPTRFLSQARAIHQLLSSMRADIDVVHVHSFGWFGMFAGISARQLALPVITKLANVGEEGIPGIRNTPLGRLRVSLLKRSDALVAMTHESVAEAQAIDYPTARILRVPNGIDVKTADAVSAHRTEQTPAAPVRVVFAGRLSATKGVADLLHAWAGLEAARSGRAHLSVLGDGPMRPELEALALSLGVTDSVTCHGFCLNVPGELAKSDVFVLPSSIEGNSNAILEAMRAGLPIVATNVGGAPMQVGPVGRPWLVSPGDRDALTAKVAALIHDDAGRAALGRAMRERVATHFAIERIAAVYEAAYEKLAAGRFGEMHTIAAPGFSEADGQNHPDRTSPCAG